jgi:hypothetical protein
MRIAEQILARIGLAILLAIPSGRKGPRRKAWQKLKVTDMTPEYLASIVAIILAFPLAKLPTGYVRLIATPRPSLKPSYKRIPPCVALWLHVARAAEMCG